MPKGVEHHTIMATTNSLIPLKRPQMPKGVEHSARRVQHAMNAPLKRPQMPKGVEHSGAAVVVLHHSTEETSDAERR